MAFLDISEGLNLRPLIMSRSKVTSIKNDPNFHEIAFYVSFHQVNPTENGVLTIRYALINISGEIYNFDGLAVSPGFDTSQFKLVSTVVFEGGYVSAVKILRKPHEVYFWDSLTIKLNTVLRPPRPNRFAMFLLGQSTPGFYKIVASVVDPIGGGGADAPGSVNNTPPP